MSIKQIQKLNQNHGTSPPPLHLSLHLSLTPWQSDRGHIDLLHTLEQFVEIMQPG